MSKHTPGPWKAFVWHRSIQIHKENEDPKDDLAIAVLRSDSGHAASDSLLIAAAPDLLDALEKLVHHMDKMADKTQSTRAHMKWSQPVVESGASKALAKAYGIPYPGKRP